MTFNNYNMNSFKEVSFKDKDYIVCQYIYKDTNNYFIIDSSKYNKIKNISWHRFGKDIAFYDKNNDDVIYLKNIISNLNIQSSKNEKINFINNNFFDLRKINLENTKEIKNKLPLDCDIDINLIPECINYDDNKNYFTANIKINNNTHFICSTDSNKLSLEYKLEHIKAILRLIKKDYPDSINSIMNENIIKSLKEYNKILKLSEYNDYKNSIIEIPEEIDLLKKNKLKDKNEYEKLKSVIENLSIENIIKKDTNTFPLPPHCYFKKASTKRGCCFVIMDHPIINKYSGTKTVQTTQNNIYTPEQKYELLKDIFKKYNCPFVPKE